MGLHALLSSPDIAFGVTFFLRSPFSSCGARRQTFWLGDVFLCQARYYHVVGWLLIRVQTVAGDYLEVCQEIAWIDSDSEQVDEADERLATHAAVCISLYEAYCSALARGFAV